MPEVSATIRINDAFSGALNKLESGLSKAQSGFNKLKSVSSSGSAGGGMFKSMLGANLAGNVVSKGMNLATNGVRSLLKTMDDSNKTWQTFDGNMRQLGVSDKSINQTKNTLQSFAEKSIYNASEMASTYSQLRAVGTKNTAQLVKAFGGLASSAEYPKQAMKTLSQQATQMAAKPYAQWQDFKLMLEQTPAGIAAVAKQMGMSTTQLVAKVQDGKVKTEELFGAIEKAGNNGYFQKMATQYKSVGEALDGFQETLGHKLKKPFKKVSDLGIKVVSALSDNLDKVNFDGIADGLIRGLTKAKSMLDQFMSGFHNSSFANSLYQMFNTIGNATKRLTSNLSSGGGMSMMSQLGKLAGDALGAVARAISGIARVIGQLDSGKIKAIAAAFLTLKFGVRGLAIGGAIAALSKLNSLDSAGLERVAQGFTAIAVASAGIKTAAQAISTLKGAIEAVSGIKDMFTSFSGLGGALNFGNLFSGISTAISFVTSEIGGMIGVIASALAGISAPVLAAIAAITGAIAGAVMAWQSNFMGFRDFVTGFFSGLFDPLKNAFSDLKNSFDGLLDPLKTAIQSAAPIIDVLKTVLMGLGVVAGAGVAFALAAIVDVIANFVSACAAAVNAAQAFSHALGGIGNALKGDFKSMKNDFAEAGNALGQLKNNFSNAFKFEGTEKVLGSIGKMASMLNGVKDKKVKVSADVDVNSAQQKIKALETGKGSKIKMQADVDVADINKKMSAFSNKGAQLAKIKPKIDTTDVSGKLQSQLSKTNATAKVKTKLDTSNVASQMAKVGKSNATVKVKAKLDASSVNSQLAKISSKRIPAPKVATPKVPTPKMPSNLKTIPAPKVGTPKVPTPKMPGNLKTIPAPKVGTPKVPAPIMPTSLKTIPAPHIGTPRVNLAGLYAQFASVSSMVIPAPHVQTPNMSGVAAAVASGMAAATAAARAGGAAISAAVSGAIQQAVAAAYAGAGAMQAAGAAIGAGLAAGIQSQIGAVAAAADALVAQANRAARAAAQVHSPSRLFAEIGNYIGQGLALGMNDTQNLVAHAGTGLINAATPSVQNGTIARPGIISPNSALETGSLSSTTENKRVIYFEPGSIQINGTGNTEEDLDLLIERIEEKIAELSDKSLF